MTSTDHAATFAAVFAAIYTGHHIGDYVAQTHHQACTKGQPGWEGRIACAGHVASLTVVKAGALAIAALTLGLHLAPAAVSTAFAVDAVSHYWADRRTTLAKLADLLAFMGKDEFYAFGAPRPGKDDNPSLGTGAAHLDQTWHLMFIFAAALIIGGLS